MVSQKSFTLKRGARRQFINHVSASGVAMRGDGGVASEGRVVGVPKFHSRGKCTVTLQISTQIGCPTLPLACVLYCYIIYLRGSFKLHLGGNYM